jgi:hypothetical protein
MTVVGLVAVCDLVTEDEQRLALAGPDPQWVPWPQPVEPGPGRYVPATPAALEADLAEFRRSATFSVHEFAILADGRRLRLNDDRGFATSTHGPGGRGDPWAHLTLDALEADVRTTVLPDEDDGEDHPWEWLAVRLGELGVRVAAEELRRVPYTVEFSERLRARVPRSG